MKNNSKLQNTFLEKVCQSIHHAFTTCTFYFSTGNINGRWGGEQTLPRHTTKSLSISHPLGIVTRQWLDSDYGIVTVDNCWQHQLLINCVVTMLPAVNNGDYAVTVQSLCRGADGMEFCCVLNQSHTTYMHQVISFYTYKRKKFNSCKVATYKWTPNLIIIRTHAT